ncbi:MAG: hypothetical protein HYT62_03620 [Candidatus Yanofskybacteria bacterium]|nr:hypothetical protein [Candidatus Yanofskybacteria bacterium]
MKYLVSLLSALMILVTVPSVYAQSGQVDTNPLVGEWSLVSFVITSEDGSSTEELVGDVDVGQKTFSMQWEDVVDSVRTYKGVSGTYDLDEAKSVVIIIVNNINDNIADKMVFKYRLLREDGDDYLELEFSLLDSLDPEVLEKMSPEDKKVFEDGFSKMRLLLVRRG